MIFGVRRPRCAILSQSFDLQFAEASADIRFFQLKCWAFVKFNSKMLTTPRRERKNDLGNRGNDDSSTFSYRNIKKQRFDMPWHRDIKRQPCFCLGTDDGSMNLYDFNTDVLVFHSRNWIAPLSGALNLIELNEWRSRLWCCDDGGDVMIYWYAMLKNDVMI